MMELLLQQAIDTLGLLLLAHLDAVLAFLDALLARLTGGIVAALHGALLGIAAVALEEQLRALAAAQAAIRSCISSHNVILSATRDDACADGNRCAE